MYGRRKYAFMVSFSRNSLGMFVMALLLLKHKPGDHSEDSRGLISLIEVVDTSSCGVAARLTSVYILWQPFELWAEMGSLQKQAKKKKFHSNE
jgi:hypothetical protein